MESTLEGAIGTPPADVDPIVNFQDALNSQGDDEYIEDDEESEDDDDDDDYDKKEDSFGREEGKVKESESKKNAAQSTRVKGEKSENAEDGQNGNGSKSSNKAIVTKEASKDPTPGDSKVESKNRNKDLKITDRTKRVKDQSSKRKADSNEEAPKENPLTVSSALLPASRRSDAALLVIGPLTRNKASGERVRDSGLVIAVFPYSTNSLMGSRL